MTVIAYPRRVERQMKAFYQSLNDDNQRRYAAIEAKKLGRGGRRYIADLFGCDEAMIRRGWRELMRLSQSPRQVP